MNSTVVIAILISLAVNEFLGVTDWSAYRITRWAAARWEAKKGFDHLDEWLEDLEHSPGRLFRVISSSWLLLSTFVDVELTLNLPSLWRFSLPLRTVLHEAFRVIFGLIEALKRRAAVRFFPNFAPRLHVAIVKAAQRAVDLTVVLVALLVLVIPMLIVALAIRLGTPGPALYRQQRIGQGGRPFTMYKFRTMRLGCSDVQHRELIARELRGEDTSVGGSWKLDSDPRVTRLGSILRRTNLDELPRLLNVLRGQMSLVGPRPCLAWEAEMFPAGFAERFDVQPGLIGFSEATAGSIMEMLELDLAYVRSWSFWSYLRLLVRTIFALLRGPYPR